MIVVVWVGGLASFGGFVAMIFIAIDKVSTGHGLDTYRTHWLVEGNWISFLVFLIVATIVGLAAVAITWFQRRKDEREIQKINAKL